MVRRIVTTAGWACLLLLAMVPVAMIAATIWAAAMNVHCGSWSDAKYRWEYRHGCQVRVAEEQWRDVP